MIYNLYINNRLPRSIKEKCCDFLLFQEKCMEYNSTKILQEV